MDYISNWKKVQVIVKEKESNMDSIDSSTTTSTVDSVTALYLIV